jgi:hypothetical protein
MGVEGEKGEEELRAYLYDISSVYICLLIPAFAVGQMVRAHEPRQSNFAGIDSSVLKPHPSVFNTRMAPKRQTAAKGMTSSLAFTKPSANREVSVSHVRLARIGLFRVLNWNWLSFNFIITIVDSEIQRGIVYGRKFMTDTAKLVVEQLLEAENKDPRGMDCGIPTLMLPSPKEKHYSYVSEFMQRYGADPGPNILIPSGVLYAQIVTTPSSFVLDAELASACRMRTSATQDVWHRHLK